LHSALRALPALPAPHWPTPCQFARLFDDAPIRAPASRRPKALCRMRLEHLRDMADGTCFKCGTTVTAGALRLNGGRAYCVPCYEKNVPLWARTTDDAPVSTPVPRLPVQ